MMRSQRLYGISLDEAEEDKLLEQRRVDLVHSGLDCLSMGLCIPGVKRRGVKEIPPHPTPPMRFRKSNGMAFPCSDVAFGKTEVCGKMVRYFMGPACTGSGRTELSNL